TWRLRCQQPAQTGVHFMDLIFPLPACHGLALLGTFLLLGTTLAHADFPDVGQLPSHPELPDPLVQLSGERVTSKEQWFQKRRPELKELFQYYMYGTFPAAKKITATLEREDRHYFGGK